MTKSELQARADMARRREIAEARRQIEAADTLSWLQRSPDIIGKIAANPVKAAVVVGLLRNLASDPETPRPDREFADKLCGELELVLVAIG